MELYAKGGMKKTSVGAMASEALKKFMDKKE